jgi:type I restriction enzyme M protein
MAIVLPHGVLFRGGEEGEIRKSLIENDHLETIIGLPPNIFFGTGIPTIILILQQKRKSSDVLIVDASKGFAKEGKSNKLRASDIKKMADTVISRGSLPRFSRLVPKTEIQDNEYNLKIPRYVDSSEPAERWDLYASMFGGIPQSELDDLVDFWQAFPKLRAALFADNGTPYVTPKVADLATAIREHAEVKHFSKKFSAAFADFNPWLRNALLEKEQMLTLQIPQQEALISEALFARLKPIALIDKYHAYQILDDHWQPIAIDLEILQTEGFDSARVVDPHMVTKKKDNKEVEVQEGWRGRILPFKLVQETHLKPGLDALSKQENRLSEITASVEEVFESLSEEDKAEDTVAGDKFVNAVVIKEAKALLAQAKRNGDFDSESYEAKIIQVAQLLNEDKTLAAETKQAAAALHLRA